MSTFDTPTPVTLSVELDAGSVTIDATTTDTTEVQLSALNPGDQDAIALIERAKVDHSGGTVTVRLPNSGSAGGHRQAPDIALLIRMPVGSTLAATLRSARLRVTGELENVRVDSASGDVTLGDVSGTVAINTASGAVRIGTVGGSLLVKSASGDVRVSTCCSTASFQTASGDVSLETAEGDLTAKTASGDLTVRVADASVSARTASGDVELGVVRAGTVEVKTVSGEVSVAVERGIAVWLDVSSLSGRVRSSLEPIDRRDDDARALGLRLTTVSGDISLAPA